MFLTVSSSWINVTIPNKLSIVYNYGKKEYSQEPATVAIVLQGVADEATSIKWIPVINSTIEKIWATARRYRPHYIEKVTMNIVSAPLDAYRNKGIQRVWGRLLQRWYDGMGALSSKFTYVTVSAQKNVVATLAKRGSDNMVMMYNYQTSKYEMFSNVLNGGKKTKPTTKNTTSKTVVSKQAAKKKKKKPASSKRNHT